MNNLLFDTNPLVIIPELAEKIGLNEAIVLQQVHYWLKHNEKEGKNFRDGRWWTYNTYDEWQKQFPWWSLSTIRRIITSLEKGYTKKEGSKQYKIPPLLIASNYNKIKIDKTKWYTINYDNLKKVINSPSAQFEQMDCSICADGKCQYEQTNTRDYQETRRKETNNNNRHSPNGEMTTTIPFSFSAYKKTHDIDEDVAEAIEYYMLKYKEYTGKNHPRLKEWQWQKVTKNILSSCYYDDSDGNCVEIPIDSYNITDIIDRHFDKDYEGKCDYNILHFIEHNIKLYRAFEAGWVD